MFLGIDTSNYTTSAAIFTGNNENPSLLWQEKLPLAVLEGHVGLRQSDAFFQHMKNLPKLISSFGCLKELKAIGVSARPRNVEGSYMPCFMAGVWTAHTLGAALSVPVFEFSHQQGHLAAALWSAGRMDLLNRHFAAWHVSGGTTELLLVSPILEALCIGGTMDSSAGQIIDRVGAALGLPFPAGCAMEKLAAAHNKTLAGKLTVNGRYFSLSGIENQALRFLKEGEDRANVAFFVINTIACAIERASLCETEEIVCCGGVMSNGFIRERFPHSVFASNWASSDNGSGPAILAQSLACKELL